MSQAEQHFKRSAVYGEWHRAASLSRFVDPADAKLILMSDIDHILWIEWDGGTREPIMLIESGFDNGASKKDQFLLRLAQRAQIPALTVQYRESPNLNPASPAGVPDISSFRVNVLWHYDRNKSTDGMDLHLSPQEFAETLVQFRKRAKDMELMRPYVNKIADEIVGLAPQTQKALIRQLSAVAPEFLATVKDYRP